MRRLLAPAFVVVTVTACSKKPIGDGNTHNPPALEDPRDRIDAASSSLTPTTTAPGEDAATTTTSTTTAKRGTHKKRKRTKDAAAGIAARFNREGPRSANPHYPALNPKDPDTQRVVYTASDDSCWVQVPPKQPPKAMVAPETEEVDCPPAMDDPAWDECNNSTILIDEKTQRCFCFANFGNPPPPEYMVTCPANAKDVLKKRADP